MEKTPQEENLFEVLNLPQFQWQGVVENASSEKKTLDEQAQVSPEAVL